MKGLGSSALFVGSPVQQVGQGGKLGTGVDGDLN